MRLKPVKRWARFHLLRAVLGMLSLLPRRWGLRVFGWLGEGAYWVLPKPREQILQNLRRIHPEWEEAACRSFAREVMRNMGRNAVDFVRLRRYGPADVEAIAHLEGAERMRACLERGRGMIGLGGHLGCWEIIPLRLRAEGFEVGVVYRRSSDPRIDRYIITRRRRAGITTHDRDTDGRGILRRLRENAIMGILIDVSTRVDSAQVPFMGHPAWTPLGVARLAMRTGAAVLPLVSYMREDGAHVVEAGEEVPIRYAPPGATREEARRLEVENTRRCNEVLGAIIARHELQWAWMHPRWRER